MTAGVSVKSSVTEPPAVSATDFFCSVYPTRSTRISTVPAGTPRSVYRPSAFVPVVRLDVTTITRASGSGSLVPTAITRPVIVPCCPCAMAGIVMHASVAAIRSRVATPVNALNTFIIPPSEI